MFRSKYDNLKHSLKQAGTVSVHKLCEGTGIMSIDIAILSVRKENEP